MTRASKEVVRLATADRLTIIGLTIVIISCLAAVYLQHRDQLVRQEEQIRLLVGTVSGLADRIYNLEQKAGH